MKSFQTCRIRPRYALSLAAVALLLVGVVPTAQALDAPERLVATVISVSSGDTMLVAAEGHRHRVRLEAAAAPGQDEPAADEARRVLEEKLLGRKVRIDHIVEDARRTLVGRVYLDGRSINKEMIDEGWAAYAGEPNQYPVLEQSEAAAKAAQLGRWRAAPPKPAPMPEETASVESQSVDEVPLDASQPPTHDPPQFPNYVPRSTDKTPAEAELATVTDELGRVQNDVITRARATEDPQAQADILASVDYAEQFSQPLLDVAAKHPATEAACWALLLVSQFEAGQTDVSRQRLSQAIERLALEHREREELGHLLLAVRGKPEESCDKSALYARLVEESPHATVRGYACYLLAMSLSEPSTALSPEAQALWERAAREFGDVKFGPQSLGEIARAMLSLPRANSPASEEQNSNPERVDSPETASADLPG